MAMVEPHIHSTTPYKQHTITHSIEDEPIDDDDVSPSEDNAAESRSLPNDNSVASEESAASEKSFGNKVFADTTE
jgi:hypothetical protein